MTQGVVMIRHSSHRVPACPARGPSALPLAAIALAASLGACASAPAAPAPAVAEGSGPNDHASGLPPNDAAADPGAKKSIPVTTGDVAIIGESRPRRLSGEDPRCTPEAKARRVSASVRARCIITPEGNLERCRLLQGTGPLDAEVRRALSGWRMTPMTHDGKRVAVDFGFPFKFACRPDGG